MKRNIIIPAAVALVVSLFIISINEYFFQKNNTLRIEHLNSAPATKTSYNISDYAKPIALDFTQTADKVMEAVVHIKSTAAMSMADQPFQFQQMPSHFGDQFGGDLFRHFFQQKNLPAKPSTPQQAPVKVGTGSGVIIDSQGYIITNNHVIEEAEDIEVTLHDNRTFKAVVVGVDPTTDLALLQIKASNLPTIPLVNSNEVKIGEWVLAIGNPFNLNSTVTAGIVSAKARNINILDEPYAIESFIQTDAAINPGNSGGALVNLDGGLIGINTAIASPTGAYAGYGFAIPANIVSKVVEDLLQYGTVQRGVLGVMIRSVDGNLAKEKGFDLIPGVYVDSLLSHSAAAAAGIKKGDVIVAVNETMVGSAPELQEAIAQHRPGEAVTIKVERNGEDKTFAVTLNNRKGNTKMLDKEEQSTLSALGADFETLDADTAHKLGIPGGVKVTALYSGKLKKHTQIREGFIITKVDDKQVLKTKDLEKALQHKSGGVKLEGVYENLPGVYYYAFGWNV